MSIKKQLMRLLQRAVVVLALAPCVVTAQPVQENTMKAAFVYNFVLFTDWPQDTLGKAETINVCINAASDMQDALLVLNGKVAKGLRLKVFPKRSLERGLEQCDVLYIDHLDRPQWPAIQRSLAAARILTISDDAQIGRNGAMITLTLYENKIVFDIDQSTARLAHLTFSSKLLRLARTVK